jgi:predicted dehydrogenase
VSKARAHAGAGQRYLIVSLGSIGHRHLRNLRAVRPASQIAALRLRAGPEEPVEGCDLQLVSMEQVAAFKPHAAILASPASTHAELARALIDAGVPVMIEKPFAHRIDGLRELVALAARKGVPLMVGYNLRFKPSLIAVRKRILDGEIGRVLSVRAEVGQYLPDWRPDKDYRQSVSGQAVLGGGVLLELSHEIDYLYWMFGLPQRVSCRGGHFSDLELDVEDTVELCLEYAEPRRLVSIHLDFVQRSVTRTCKFVGTLGSLSWDGIADRIDTVTVEPPAHGSVVIATPEKNQMYIEEIEHFLQCCSDSSKPAIDGVQAFEVMAIIEAARASMLHGSVERPVSYA